MLQHVFNEQVARERLAEYIMEEAGLEDLARLASEYLLDDEVIITGEPGEQSQRYYHGKPVAGGWSPGSSTSSEATRSA